MVVTFVKMPKLTWTMEEGLVARWLKKEGEEVKEGEALCEVETEKTVDEVLSPASGVLRKLITSEGQTIPVNGIMAVISGPDEELPDINKMVGGVVGVERPEAKVEPELVKPEVSTPEVEAAERGRMRVSPAARKLAEEHGIDLMKITGTGPDGRIVREDVLRAVEDVKVHLTGLPSLEASKVVPLEGKRKVIARRLSLSAHTALHVPITMEVDVAETVDLREEFLPEIEKETGCRLTYTHILVKAVAKALERHPVVNSLFVDEEVRLFDDINIGVATVVEDGLVVPVIHNANRKSLSEIVSLTNELVEKARGGTLSTREASGGTFTISNLGMLDVDIFAPIINPPESAILGVGRIVRKPVVIDEKIVIRPTMTLTLVWDHRVMDGVQAAKFLQSLKKILENPRPLLE